MENSLFLTFSSFLFVIHFVPLAASTPSYLSFLQCLSKHSHPSDHLLSRVYTPNNSSYKSVLQHYIRNQRFNRSTTPKPDIIFTPLQESHVQVAVTCCRKTDKYLKIRSGGHDYEGISYVSNISFVLLDMSNLRSIDVDIQNETAWVQAGALLGELYYRIWEKSKVHAFPAGVCPTVGVGGHITGGGYGDSRELLSIMDRDFPQLGLRIEDCKEMSWIESELFWASFPNETLPDALLNRKPGAKFLKRKSDYLQKPIPKDKLKSIFDKMIELGDTVLVFNQYGGRMSEIPEWETPFPHRAGNIFKIQYAANWGKEGKEAENFYINQTRVLYNYMTPFVSKSPRCAYLNYRDLDIGVNHNGNNRYIEGRVYGLKYFKDNFNKLVKVKTLVDPDNFFWNEQSIPPLAA
ncbi:hypothetical protein MTR67_009719 [Solanum verrucosum]|uniref:FAD-binding PCMH-type domain-containing protein n=1 Tax=Solanum verrucosum TaxID=315347 RepID=A0AAF0Q3Q1_SOLVR|nr:hypothetical protein MTR67_009719 [Solanum verrucosum]